MAIINLKETVSDYVGDWKKACGKCFNSTRVFNAHQATYAERIALLESLKGIHQDWEPALATAIQAFRDDWASRLRRVAMTICDLLEGCLLHVETTNLFQTQEEADAKRASVERYQAAIGKKESEARCEMRRLFKHNIFDVELPNQSILHEDLFTEKTWQLLGLSRKQIIAAAAIIGGGVGAKLDVVFAGLTFGIFTVSGAALGAAAAWLKGENMAKTRVKKLRLGGVQISVGPNRNPQFPFVLLDRALLYFQLTINWAHARRDTPDLPSTADGEEKLGFTSSWGRGRRKTCAEFVKRLNSGNREKIETAKKEFKEMLSTVLLELSVQGTRGEGRGTRD